MQLPLGLYLRDDATFANFFVGENVALVACVKALLQKNTEPLIYLWGSKGVGRSHLLQAACHAAGELNLTAAYIPLSASQEFAPQMLEGLENLALVCLDDIEVIAGDKAWQEALFHFYNKAREHNTRLLVAATVAPLHLPLTLADLNSRLAAGVTFQVQALSDEAKLQALQLRAKRRGLDLSMEVGNFILRRCSREFPVLYQLLEKLDQASLTEQRRLTIPFVKAVLGV